MFWNQFCDLLEIKSSQNWSKLTWLKQLFKHLILPIWFGRLITMSGCVSVRGGSWRGWSGCGSGRYAVSSLPTFQIQIQLRAIRSEYSRIFQAFPQPETPEPLQTTKLDDMIIGSWIVGRGAPNCFVAGYPTNYMNFSIQNTGNLTLQRKLNI